MFHELTIADVRHETPDSVAVSFAVPEELRDAFAWKPGQYLTLRAEVGGQDARRSYSIASAPGKPLTVGVKHVEGGLFSTFCQGLEPGQVIRVMPPEGRFVPKDEAKIVLIAAGSGITPMVSIAA
ncbi:MAG: FAD-binding oxidoreductase, partial [Rhodosalinus sp.]